MKHSVINKEKEDKEKEEGEENLGTSKFEAALKDLEALGRGQGTRYFLIMIPWIRKFLMSVFSIDIGHLILLSTGGKQCLSQGSGRRERVIRSRKDLRATFLTERKPLACFTFRCIALGFLMKDDTMLTTCSMRR